MLNKIFENAQKIIMTSLDQIIIKNEIFLKVGRGLYYNMIEQ
jgi:hypothetical protein